MPEALKPCPFCGDEVRPVGGDVLCQNCGTFLMPYERWNSRQVRDTSPVNICDAEDALLAWFDQPVKYDAMGFTRTLRSLIAPTVDTEAIRRVAESIGRRCSEKWHKASGKAFSRPVAECGCGLAAELRKAIGE